MPTSLDKPQRQAEGARVNSRHIQASQAEKTHPQQAEHHRPKNDWSWFDVIEMQTEFALFQSMARSKTLTVMVCLGALAYGGFILFLLKMAA
ncbi:hypothetical protein [uncultured Shewanella sp.]|uniref:hypothetical protein n=1 Tax=uncultured Shewanella sp. TaxID=173975 RepID=UPI00261B4EC4|nr:hypothetical protein [uncultured Shewanella sp.]